MTDAGGETTPKAGRREWIGLAVLALPCVLYSMDLTVLNLAVPHLTADLQPSSSQLLWIIDIYGFLVAGSLITMGTLGDRIGRRKLLMIGAAAFGAGSVLAAFSNSAEMLIATRALLGVAGATLAPSTLSLIRNMFLDPEQRTFAIGVWITSYSVGGMIGPVVGGVMLQYFWWGSVFLIGVPVMVLLLILGPMLLPEFRDPGAGRLDLISAGMSLGAVLLVIYGLKRIAEDGFGSLPLLFIAAGFLAGLLFVRRQLKLTHPLIDLSLFRIPAFSASLAANLLNCFVAFGAFIYVAQYLQMVQGFTPLRSGMLMIPSSIGFIAGSMLTPRIVRRFRPSYVTGGGLLMAAIGFLVLTRIDASSGVGYLVAGSLIYSIGLALAFTVATDIIVGSAPPERAGAAAAISETFAEFGGALGIAVLGSIGTAIYRRSMADAVAGSIPIEAADAARATLAGALVTAEGLQPLLRADLIAAARHAFAAAMHVVYSINVAVMVVTAIIVTTLLNKNRTT